MSFIKRFPFDTKNPIGYLAACSLQYAHLSYEFFFLANLVTLGVGSFFMALTVIEDLKGILRSINDQCTKKRSMKKRLEALNQLREFVQMHSIIKQLSTETTRLTASTLLPVKQLSFAIWLIFLSRCVYFSSGYSKGSRTLPSQSLCFCLLGA